MVQIIRLQSEISADQKHFPNLFYSIHLKECGVECRKICLFTIFRVRKMYKTPKNGLFQNSIFWRVWAKLKWDSKKCQWFHSFFSSVSYGKRILLCSYDHVHGWVVLWSMLKIERTLKNTGSKKPFFSCRNFCQKFFSKFFSCSFGLSL